VTKYIGSLPQIHLIFFLLRFIINFVLFFSPRQKGGVPVHRPSRPQVLVTSPPNIMKPSEQICRATLLKLLLFKPRVGNNSICPLIKGSNGSHSTAVNMWNSYVNQSVYMPLNTFVRQTGQLIYLYTGRPRSQSSCRLRSAILSFLAEWIPFDKLIRKCFDVFLPASAFDWPM
jgi:hypothetical protein